MKNKTYSIQELADFLSVRFEGNGEHVLQGVNSLELATPTEISFFSEDAYLKQYEKTKAGLICISPNAPKFPHQNYLVVDNPSQLFQKIAAIFVLHQNVTEFSGIHPTAVIHPTATVAENVSLGPYVVIDAHVNVGKNTTILAHSYIASHTTIGENCWIHAQCTIRENCILKDRVILQPGVVIGSCGFGYTTDAKGVHHKLEQLGNVILEEDVEIGANTCIDRARFSSTIIGKGTKLDNLIQIGHNVHLGKSNIFAAQTGIAGSTKTGNLVFGGGQVGILGHIEIADQVMLATRSGASKNITEPGKYRGSPAIPLKEYGRQKAHVRKLEQYVQRIKQLEQQIEELTKKIS